ncbi:ParB/RepB/Spo0J family partition protein [Moraxella nasibovis]|uniref:ParB/RepB/Spo0J family partition protein n=1 Tax=Moraxella nasibovis TaxID=2904120 RepID=UPI002410B1A1|nr:ParB/RepB/Spo0J family partition protein [Moraxella nasibovis]WFF39232.1 ParB/RepB/Spo0J family partition protein [Moraxella nasibovis]
MKKRGLGAKRGLDALMGSLKKERQIVSGEITPPLAPKGLGDEVAVKFDLLDDETDIPTIQADKTKKAKKKSKNKSADTHEDGKGEQVTLIEIGTERLQSGKYQPRRDMNEEALGELANSIRQHGIMQPIVIRPLLSGEDKTSDAVTHEIIAGERRWRAAKMAGLASIPAIERVLSDEIAIALALIENIQREDLNVLEQAAALQRFHSEFGMSHAMIADVVGKARATVSNLLRLNNLHDTVKDYMQEGLLDMGHARTLLSLSAKQQPIIAKKIIDAKMTVRDAEKLVKSILNPEPAKKDKTDSHEIKALSQKISDALGASVKIKQGQDGKGSVEIFFHDDDELQGLLAQFGLDLSALG